MLNFILTRDENTGRVPYFFRNDEKHPVAGLTSFEAAMWQLNQGKVHASDEFEGYPLTSDDVYFFAGEYEVEPEDAEKKPSRKTTKKRVKE